MSANHNAITKPDAIVPLSTAIRLKYPTRASLTKHAAQPNTKLQATSVQDLAVPPITPMRMRPKYPRLASSTKHAVAIVPLSALIRPKYPTRASLTKHAAESNTDFQAKSLQDLAVPLSTTLRPKYPKRASSTKHTIQPKVPMVILRPADAEGESFYILHTPYDPSYINKQPKRWPSPIASSAAETSTTGTLELPAKTSLIGHRMQAGARRATIEKTMEGKIEALCWALHGAMKGNVGKDDVEISAREA
jgi:hypothetical protein